MNRSRSIFGNFSQDKEIYYLNLLEILDSMYINVQKNRSQISLQYDEILCNIKAVPSDLNINYYIMCR